MKEDFCVLTLIPLEFVGDRRRDVKHSPQSRRGRSFLFVFRSTRWQNQPCQSWVGSGSWLGFPECRKKVSGWCGLAKKEQSCSISQ